MPMRFWRKYKPLKLYELSSNSGSSLKNDAEGKRTNIPRKSGSGRIQSNAESEEIMS
jgi:hypothetical protein